MANRRLLNSIFVALVILGVIQAGYYAPRIPATVATHFAESGVGTAWVTKAAFLLVEIVMVLVATLITFGVPKIVASLPVSAINVPNKDFWLASGRREATMELLQTRLAWFGCAMLTFFLVVMELVFRANLRTPPQMDTTTLMVVTFAFLAFTMIWVARLVTYFRRN